MGRYDLMHRLRAAFGGEMAIAVRQAAGKRVRYADLAG